MDRHLPTENSETKTKSLYRNIAYTGWILFVAFLILWDFKAINGNRALISLVVSGCLGSVFTALMSRKKISGEEIEEKNSS